MNKELHKFQVEGKGKPKNDSKIILMNKKEGRKIKQGVTMRVQ